MAPGEGGKIPAGPTDARLWADTFTTDHVTGLGDQTKKTPVYLVRKGRAR